jgi:hypothetical protein
MNNYHDQEADTKIKTIVEDLFKEINVMGKEDEISSTLHKIISQEHKTLQQSFIRIMHQFFTKYSANKNYDLRNEASVRFAEQIKQMEVFLPHV